MHLVNNTTKDDQRIVKRRSERDAKLSSEATCKHWKGRVKGGSGAKGKCGERMAQRDGLDSTP